jgi:hypothetical protein
VEGLHHLHCLNLVRKALYFNYDYYKELGMHAFKNEEYILRRHVTHCLDTVRQVLMCNVDTGVLGQVWVYPDEPTAFPDFNTRHICKNYEAVRVWAEKMQVSSDNRLHGCGILTLSKAPPTEETPDGYMAPPRDVRAAIP